MRTDLSAAQSVTGAEETALIGNLRDGYIDCDRVDGRLSCERLKADLDGRELAHFTAAGFTLSDYYCDVFFRQTNQAARHRRFARNLNNDVGGVVATVLGLAKAGSGVVGGVAAGFSLADGSFRNYDEAFMVDADLAKLRRLVLSAQDNMKLAVQAKPPTTVFAAESTILRYAGLCSFLGMQDLLNDSVAAKTASIEAENRRLQPTDGDTPVGEGGPPLGVVPTPDAPSPVQAPVQAPAPSISPPAPPGG